MEHLFSFHFANSLIPGMTLPLTLAAVAAALWAAVNYRRLDTAERILLLFASSFIYGRYFAGLTMPDQPPKVYAKAGRYARLLSGFECVEIRPRLRSFAFSNPVLRIVDLRRPTPQPSGFKVRVHGSARQ